MTEQIPAGTWSPSAAPLRLGSWLPPLGVSIVVLILWEVVFFGLDIKSFLLPRPSVIVGQLIVLWPTTLARGLAFTGSEALAGLAVGVALGTVAGLGTARWAFARETVVPVAIGASTVPIIAFAPITLNWFGPESPLPRIIIVALMVFFPVLVNTIRGLTEVDHDALELMASYAATDVQTLRKLRIPNAMPSYRGWIYCRDNPDKCVAIVLKSGSQLGASHQAWQMNEINALIWPSPNGIGTLDMTLWNQTIQIATTYGVLKAAPSQGAFRTDLAAAALTALGSSVDTKGASFAPQKITLNAGGN